MARWMPAFQVRLLLMLMREQCAVGGVQFAVSNETNPNAANNYPQITPITQIHKNKSVETALR